MRTWLAIIIGVALLAPSFASAQILSLEQAGKPAFQSASAHPAECSRLRRQVDHFSNMQARAVALEHELWKERLAKHLELLRGMQAARCPQDLPPDSVAEAFKTLMQLAAKGAMTYFSMGAF